MPHIKKDVINVIIFDFDNVIVRGSEACKKEAWVDVFEHGSPEMVRLQEALSLFKDGKGDRFAILGYVFGAIGDPHQDSKVIEASKLYDEGVRKRIVHIGVHNDDLTALLALSQRFPLCINSATPESALRTTLLQLGELYSIDFLSLFTLVLGTPKTKVENFKKVKEVIGLPFSRMLMVGDGENDRLAAQEVGAPFVGVRTEGNEARWNDATFPQIRAVCELAHLI